MIKLGRHSYCYGVQRGTMNNVHVGNFTSIAQGVIFDGGFNHRMDGATTFPLHSIWSDVESNILQPMDIHIGHNVWIGEDAIIMGGVTIGNGAIIGARTIVTKDVPEYHLAKGAPMKHSLIYDLDCGEWKMIRDLAWWEWDDQKIYENRHLLAGGRKGLWELANKYLGYELNLE